MQVHGEHIVFVHAHPDDETISTGGTIAELVARGSGVTVLSCTRGERVRSSPPNCGTSRVMGSASANSARPSWLLPCRR